MPGSDASPGRGIHLGFSRPKDTPAQAAARAFLHCYGITTKPYVKGGGDHPMMRTLPSAFEAFAREHRVVPPEWPSEESERVFGSVNVGAFDSI